MSRARDNADLGDSYGSLAVGVTGGSGLNALSASNLSAGTIADARMPNLTGDVTTVEGAVATTIATDAVDIAMLSATGTAGATTFLRGDNSWQTAGSTSASDLDIGTLGALRLPVGSVVSYSNFIAAKTDTNMTSASEAYANVDASLELTITRKYSNSNSVIIVYLYTSARNNAATAYSQLTCCETTSSTQTYASGGDLMTDDKASTYWHTGSGARYTPITDIWSSKELNATHAADVTLYYNFYLKTNNSGYPASFTYENSSYLLYATEVRLS